MKKRTVNSTLVLSCSSERLCGCDGSLLLMPRTHSSPDAPPEEQAYSHAVEANGFLFTAGQVPMTTDGELIDGSVSKKTQQIMRNLEAILDEADLGFGDVVKTTAYFTDIDDFAELDQVYKEYFDDGYPARDVVEVEALPGGASIELVMVCALDTSD